MTNFSRLSSSLLLYWAPLKTALASWVPSLKIVIIIVIIIIIIIIIVIIIVNTYILQLM